MVVWLWHFKWILLFNVKYFQLILCSPGLFLARTLTHLFIIKSHKLNFASHIISEVSYLNANIDLECCNMQTRYIRVSFQLWNTSQDHDPSNPPNSLTNPFTLRYYPLHQLTTQNIVTEFDFCPLASYSTSKEILLLQTLLDSQTRF